MSKAKTKLMDFFSDKTRVVNSLLDHIVEIVLVIVVIFFWIASPHFMTLPNWLNILQTSSLKGVIAFGMTMVIIAGQIDLSIGSIVALGGIFVATLAKPYAGDLQTQTWMTIVGILVALIFAIAVGIIHGVSQHKFKMPSFIVTLATQLAFFGLAGTICRGKPIANGFPEWFYWLGTGKIGIIPVPVIVMLIAFLIINFLMKYTNTGRAIYAVGGNEDAARLNGINVQKAKIIAFASTAVLSVIGGLMNSAQVMSATFSFGKGWELDVIASVSIGGTSMTGGVGRVWGTLVGVIFFGVISNGMTQLNISVYVQYIVKGLLLFFAVLFSIFLAERKK